MNKIALLITGLFFSFMLNAQISESFEGPDFPPAGWATYLQAADTVFEADSEWAISASYANLGNKSAYSDFDLYFETWTWLVTPLYTPTTENHILYFSQRQFDEDDDWFSEYFIKVTTGHQDSLDNYVTIYEHDESGFGEEFSPDSVDLSAYIDSAIYIAFIHYQDNSDNWYIDDVRTQNIDPPNPTTTPSPADGATVNIVNSQQTVVDFSWAAATTGTESEFYGFFVDVVDTDLRKIGTRVVTDAHPRIFHFNTTYYWQALAGNTSGEALGSSVWSFTTNPQPTVVAPYTEDFENRGYVPDGMDQLVINNEFWQFANAATHLGNGGDAGGTTSASGNYFAYIDDSSPHSKNTSILTPFIDVTALNQPGLSFYLISDKEDDSLNVDLTVFVWDGVAWDSVYYHNGNTTGWEKQEVDLSGLNITGPIQVKFVGSEASFSYTDDDLAIDDISVYELNPDGIVNVNPIIGLAYFPNPVKNRLNINAGETVSAIEIYDVLGQQVLVETMSSNSASINTSGLDSGTYIVKVHANEKVNSFKIVIAQ